MSGVMQDASMTPTGDDIAKIEVATTRCTPVNQFWLTYDFEKRRSHLGVNAWANSENIHMKYTLVGIETANGFPKPI